MKARHEIVVNERDESRLARSWQSLQAAEVDRTQRGLAFGKECYELREKHKTPGGVGNKGEGIYPTLDKLKIPKSTAYYWIAKYEKSVGLWEPAPKPEPKPTVERPAVSPQKICDLVNEDRAAEVAKLFLSFLPHSELQKIYSRVVKSKQAEEQMQLEVMWLYLERTIYKQETRNANTFVP